MIDEVWTDRAKDILEVINTSNRTAFKSIIPKEHFREPVLTEEKLLEEWERMTFYAWESRGKIVGVAALQVLGEGIGQVRYVYILPRYQRQGIGSALVTCVETKAKEKGLSKLKVLPMEKARWAVSFYERLGYRLVEKIK
jgi:N-acetylglutamate synthase-like GNAT family acetyltransferase